MSQKPTVKAIIIREYLLKYPNHSKLSLAKLIVKEHPMLFDDVESARSGIRHYTGTNGNYKRKYKTAFYEELRKPI